jgi:uncharacterized membrane protein YGL010W
MEARLMITRLFAEYGAFHKDKRNIACHEIGIPLIVLSLFALLELVRVGPIDAAIAVAVLVLIYYVRLSPPLAVAALFAFALFYWVARFVSWPLAVGAFMIGWMLQFIGHRFEGRNPAFMTNIVHLLIGPLWICWIVAGGKRETSF